MIAALLAVAAAAAGAWAFWRYVWFLRDPPRRPPAGPGFVSPADGTVVYVKRAAPGEKVWSIKRGLAATLEDILREDVDAPKLVIGVFMSPFDVHHNRVPFDARVAFVHRHPGRGRNAWMARMHWRSVLGIAPRYAGSEHLVRNERVVTAFEGTYADEPLRAYVVQIGARTVGGIVSRHEPGEFVQRGAPFGLIRVGSQVDLVLPLRGGLEPQVREGDRVLAGVTIVAR